MKTKANNDINFVRNKLKETKLRNLLKYGNNDTVTINVRKGNTTCFTLPIFNDYTTSSTYRYKIEDTFAETGYK